MDTQFISNVFLPGISLLLTAISLGVVVITLRQNSKMLEASSRPVISIYAQSIELDTSSLYLVVKNFGNSTAYLTKFVSDFDFSGCYFDLPGDYLEQLSSCTIAPGQSRVCLLDSNKVKDKVHFSIEYKSSTKTYSEEMDVNLLSGVRMPRKMPDTEGKEFQIISLALQEIIVRNM